MVWLWYIEMVEFAFELIKTAVISDPWKKSAFNVLVQEDREWMYTIYAKSH